MVLMVKNNYNLLGFIMSFPVQLNKPSTSMAKIKENLLFCPEQTEEQNLEENEFST